MRPRRVQADRLVFVCALGATATTLAEVTTRGNIALELVAAAALGLFLGPIYPLSMAAGAGLVPAAAGRVATLVVASSQAGGTVVPWAQGLLFGYGPGWGLTLTAVICAVMALLQLAYLRARRASPTLALSPEAPVP